MRLVDAKARIARCRSHPPWQPTRIDRQLLGQRAKSQSRPGTAAQERQLCYVLPNLSIDRCVLSLTVKQRNIGASSDAAMRQSVKG
jgi:hypothetical protein